MYMVYVVYVQEKNRKREPWNGRGKTVERPSNAVEMPKKAWKCLNKAWKGFPNKNDIFVGCAGYGITEQNNMIQICNFLIHDRQCSRPSLVKVLIDHCQRSFFVASYWNLLKQSLRVDLIGMRPFGALYM